MNSATCYIFGSVESPIKPPVLAADDLLIAADAGYLFIKKLGLSPDLVVGDFDSLGYVPENETVEKHATHKDDTDTLLACRIGLEKGFRRFEIFGGVGGRFDHSIANLQILAFLAEQGARAYLCGQAFCATAVKNGMLRFQSAKGTISVFSLGEKSCGVTLRGLEYPLTDAVVTPDFPIGVSNRFCSKEATVTVQKGLLTVLWCGSPDDVVEES